MNEIAVRRPRRLWLYAPLLLVILLAGAWTGVWFYAAQRAETLIAAWIEREASNGRTYACASRKVGGYPFRIEVRCAEPTVTLREGGETVVLKARELLAVAQIYQPDLVIAEASGPMTVATGAGQPLYVAEWKLLQASLRGRPRAPERVSLVVDSPKLNAAAGEAVARAERLEAHARRSPGADAGNPAFDLTVQTTKGSVSIFPALADKPFDAEALAVLHGVKDFAAKPMPERLREWQAAGGRLELKSARFKQGEALAVAKGEVGLSAEGRLDGSIALTLAGLDHVANMLLGQGGTGRMGLLAGLSMLGRTELEGRRAVSLPLHFRDGRVFFGPIPVGRLEALY